MKHNVQLLVLNTIPHQKEPRIFKKRLAPVSGQGYIQDECQRFLKNTGMSQGKRSQFERAPVAEYGAI